MKNLKMYFGLALVCLFMAEFSMAQEIFQHERLKKIWETKDGLKTPESALYDSERKVIFVSNVNEKPWEKDGNGFISKLTPEGEFIAIEWVKGLDGPKGMGIYKGKLYVANIDEVVEIDIDKAMILNRYTNGRAKNLNDITVGNDGTVYVSDSGDKCIYALKKGKLELWFDSDETSKPNGLFVVKDKLLVGLQEKVVSIDIKSKKITLFVDKTGPIDGLVSDGKGNFLISDWKGNVYQIHPGEPILKLLDTTPKQINAADIYYIIEKKTLLVPTFFANKLVAYKLE